MTTFYGAFQKEAFQTDAFQTVDEIFIFETCIANAEGIRQAAFTAARLAFPAPNQYPALKAAFLAADIAYWQAVLACARTAGETCPNVEFALAAARKQQP
jgi:hypothetical protein